MCVCVPSMWRVKRNPQKCWCISFQHFTYIVFSLFCLFFIWNTRVCGIFAIADYPTTHKHTNHLSTCVADNKSQIYHSLSRYTSQSWPYQHLHWSQHANSATVFRAEHDAHKVRRKYFAGHMEQQQGDDHSAAGSAAVRNSVAFNWHARGDVFR